jgi:hypothetical protein
LALTAASGFSGKRLAKYASLCAWNIRAVDRNQFGERELDFGLQCRDDIGDVRLADDEPRGARWDRQELVFDRRENACDDKLDILGAMELAYRFSASSCCFSPAIAKGRRGGVHLSFFSAIAFLTSSGIAASSVSK